MKNINVHVTSEVDSHACPICKKFVGRLVDDRHGAKCLKCSLNAASIYSWYMYRSNFICLICFNTYTKASLLIDHYLRHSEHDVNVFGMSRYILARVDRQVCAEQEKAMQADVKDFRMSSNRVT